MQGTSNTVTLSYNCVYEGVVLDVNIITRLVTVSVNGVILKGCHVMNAAAGSFLGVQTVALPIVGTMVLVVHCVSCDYVVGGQLEVGPPSNVWASTITGDVNYDVLDKADSLTAVSTAPEKNNPGDNLPIDMFPGEWEKTTGIGPVLRLLYNFAQLDSGSLAKIETHLMNDMVRIVDNYFAHHHVGGDELIWSAGRNTWESHFTQYPHEAEGKLEQNEPVADVLKDGGYDTASKCEPDITSATGRWRKSTYIGFLGDMIHTWVTHPTEVASTYMPDAERPTNFRQWIGSDGTYMVQAAGGIQLEVSPYIISPIVTSAWNKPDLNLKAEMDNLDSTYLKIWGKGPQWEDLHVSCWQMRSYLRYIPLWHSLARWRQLQESGYCRIPVQTDVKQGDPSAGEADRGAVTGTEPYKGYAAINLSPAGTITITDGVGCSIIIDGNTIQLASAGNMEIKAGGILTLSGRNVIMQAADDIEISSFFGGIIAKARSTFKTLVEKGRIWFKSDMDPDDDDEPEYPLEDSAAPTIEKEKYAIVLDAPRGKILNIGTKGFVAATNGEEANISLEASGKDADVNILSSRDVNILTSKLLKIRAYAAGIKSGVMKFTSSILKIGERFLIQGGSVKAGTIHANTLMAASHISKAAHVSKKDDLEPPEYENEKADELDAELQAMNRQDLESKYRQEELPSLYFEMPDWGIETDSVASWKSFKASAWDDTVQIVGDDRAVTLSLSSTNLLANTRTSSANPPWPGKFAKRMYFSGFPKQPLVDPVASYTDTDIATSSDFIALEFTRNYRSKS